MSQDQKQHRSSREISRYQSSRNEFCGLMAALSVVLMLSGGLIPIATYCVPMMAGILLLPIMIEHGKKSAWTTSAAVSRIVLLLGIDKEAAAFYLFFGCYPLIKCEIDRIRNKLFRFLIKLFVFNIALLAMYALLGIILNMDALVQEFLVMGPWLLLLFVLFFNLCLFLLDRLLVPLIMLYVHRIRPRLRFLKR